MPNQRTRSFLNKIFIFPAHKSCRNPLGRLGPWRCASRALPADPHSGLKALERPEGRGGPAAVPEPSLPAGPRARASEARFVESG